ncbi:ABC transporter substrate-binding protein [Tepidanaerobacter syntrophicus]|uniref:Peptide/nickel transport system substrate-binding protein n=1 Tax=Tepidanaerobacter syntrophicus TaxID=224999 RepID=A0A0U9HE95_9FIRM|nr:ABC transporter substrate-binding protein [Tepidanaerobacter syntrophicus]GAQ25141.1 peptide/nickel transport system substrate-binding protein [Tepidanaerobacter syntrophicus]GLI18628.1 peptide ABC transporter substrate-binding protein [Tepidanaerobacter syntrophicus]HHV82276.1 ABC transporter substrate-binding protein [Tepidanaerobacter syntrophicus]
MKKVRQFLVLLLILILCVSLVAGCAQSANKAPTNSKNTQENQTKVKNPDTMVVAYNDQPTTLDPHIAYDPESLQAISQVYEGLVTYKGGTNEVVPQLAERWETSSDGKVWTFYLKKNIKFTDGAPFNADAVKTSFERLLKINQGPAWMFDMIKSIDVVDEYTVRFNLEYAFVPFIHALANPSGPMIISPKAIKEHEENGDLAQNWLRQNMVGTGPYMLESWNMGQDFTLVKNPDYWGGWEGKHVSKVVYKVVQESSSQRLMLESGDADFANAIPRDVIEDLSKNPDITVQVDSTVNLLNLFFNNQRGALKDKRVRQAMAYGFSYDDCIKGVFNNLGKRMQGPLPPGMWAHDSTIKPYEKDVEKAKKLLEEAGYPGGKGLKFTIMVETGSEDYKKVAELFQSDMKELGIDISIQVLAWATIKDMLASAETAPDMFISGFYPDYLDPDNVLYALYSSRTIGSINESFYTNPQVDQLLEEARRSTDLAHREELYKRAQQIINDDCPAIFILVRDNITTMRSWVKGFVFHPILVNRYYFMYKE